MNGSKLQSGPNVKDVIVVDDDVANCCCCNAPGLGVSITSLE
jgi:hypothetical protein